MGSRLITFLLNQLLHIVLRSVALVNLLHVVPQHAREVNEMEAVRYVREDVFVQLRVIDLVNSEIDDPTMFGIEIFNA